MVDPFDTSTKLSAGSAQDKFLLILGIFVGFLAFFVENWLIFIEVNGGFSIYTEGQQEHQTITQARSDKKLVRTVGRNAPCFRPRRWFSGVNSGVIKTGANRSEKKSDLFVVFLDRLQFICIL